MSYIKGLVYAMSLYTRIPMPASRLEREDGKKAIVFLPAAGAVIGILIYVISIVFGNNVIPVLFKLSVYILIPLLVTGGFHVDGFMDVADARSSYKSREEKVMLPGRLKRDVEAFCVIRQGEPAELTLKADDIRITKTGAVAEAARTRALDGNDIRKQIMKTGNSDFNIISVDINTDNSSFVPVSSLNELRRQAFETLYERLNSGYKRSL